MGVPILLRDFESDTVGSLPANFVQVSGTTAQVSSSVAIHGNKSVSSTASTSPTNKDTIVYTGSGTFTDCEVEFTTRVRITGAPANQTNASAQCSTYDPFLRCSNSVVSGYDFNFVSCGTNGGTTGKVFLFRYASGTGTAVGSTVTLPSNYWRTGVLADGDLIHIKVKATGASPVVLSWKSWLDGGVEPATYAGTWTDSGAPIASGYIGLFANTSTTGQGQIAADDFSIMDITSSALGMPGLTVVSKTATSIDVTTSGASGGSGTYTGYQLYSSPTSGSLGTAVSGATTLYTHITGLTTYTTYFLTMVVTDSLGATYSTPQIQVTTTGTVGTIGVNYSVIYTTTTQDVEVLLTGITTSWSGSPFTVSGAGASITTQTAHSTTSGVIKLRAGATPGTCTISDGTNTSAAITIATGTVIAPNDSRIQHLGITNVGAQEAIDMSSGPGFRYYYSNDGSRLRWNVDGITVFPRVFTNIDGNGDVITDLTAASPVVNLLPTYTSSTTVKALTHSLDAKYAIFEGVGSPQPTINQWTNLLGAARFAGIDLIGSAAMLALPPANPNLIIFITDSTGIGIHNFYTGGTSDNTMMDVPRIWPIRVAARLGMEPNVRGYGGTGIVSSGSGGVPNAPTAYGHAYSGVTYTAPFPATLGVIYLGINDGAANSATYQAGYVTLLQAMRAENPSIVILCCNPHSLSGVNSRLTDITAAIATAGATGTWAFPYDAHGIPVTGNDLANGGIDVHFSPGGNTLMTEAITTQLQTLMNTLGIKLQAASSPGGGGFSGGFSS